MGTRFDTRGFPIVIVRPEGTATDEDLHERFAFVSSQLASGHRFALIFDSRSSAPLSTRHRRMWSRFIVENEEVIRERLVGCAILVSSAITRAVYKGIFWLKPPPIAILFVDSEEEAEAELSRRLHETRVGAS